MYPKFIIPILTILVSGCASVIDGGYQDIYIQTTCNKEVVESKCTATNEFFSWEITTPNRISIHRAKSDLVLICSSERFFNQKLIVSSKANIPMYSNFIYGGGVGTILDNNDGAGFNYPKSVDFAVRGCATVTWVKK